jgi:2-dehydropantoate 2-reductase
VRRLRHRITAKTTIVLVQNGMGVYEELVRELFPSRWRRPQFILTANTHGAWTRRERVSVHAGLGTLEFGLVPDPRGRNFERGFRVAPRPEDRRGALDDISNPPGDKRAAHYLPLRNTVSALAAMDLGTRWRPIAELELAMRRKLVVNAVINSLSAILGCRNGDVFATKSALGILGRVCAEAEAVFTAQLRAQVAEREERQRLADARLEETQQPAEVAQDTVSQSTQPTARPRGGRLIVGTQANLDAPPEVDPAELEADTRPAADNPAELSVPDDAPELPPSLRADALSRECLRVAGRTSENVSSMLADIRRGRETEVEYINGYLVRLGAQHGVPTPVTATLLHLVKMRTAIPLDASLGRYR